MGCRVCGEGLQFEPVKSGVKIGLYRMWSKVTITDGVRGDLVAVQGCIKIKEEISVV